MDNLLETEATAGGQRVSVNAFLRGTDGGVCSTCHQHADTLVNGKCTKHVVLFTGESGQPNLLQGDGGTRSKAGSCRPNR